MARGVIPVGWPEKCAAFAAEMWVVLGLWDGAVDASADRDGALEPRSYSHWGMFYG